MYYNSKEVKDILGVSIRDTTKKLSWRLPLKIFLDCYAILLSLLILGCIN